MDPQMILIFELAEFKITITNIFKKIEHNMDNFNSEICKRYQIEVPEVKPQ